MTASTSSNRFFKFWRTDRSKTLVDEKSPQTQPNIKPSATKQLGRWGYDRPKLQQMSDVEVLKRMRDHVLFHVDNLTANNGKLQVSLKIKTKTKKKNVPSFFFYKKKKTSIKAKSEKMQEEATRALESLVTTSKENQQEYRDDDDFDTRQTALWIMNNFLPKSTADNLVPTMEQLPTVNENGSLEDENQKKEKLTPIKRLRKAAQRVMVTLIIQKTKLHSTISMLNHHEPLQRCLAKIGEWEFNVFDLYNIEVCKDQCLVLATFHILSQLDMIRQLDISDRKLWNFLRDVEQNYNDIPYHNKLHALDVTNTLYFVLQSEFMRNHISPLDKIAAVLSACAHDLGHDGYNNAYHIAVGSDIALTYNDVSVLENYHISRTFFLLKKNNNNWYQRLTRPMRNYFRNVMINLVLATDMHFHFRELARLREMLAAFRFVSFSKQLLYNMNIYVYIQEIKLRPNTSMDDSKQGELLASLQNFPELMTPTSSDGSSRVIRACANECILAKKKKQNKIAIKNEALTNVLIPEKQVESESSRVSGVEDERLFMLSAAIHACDISNPTKDLKICNEWADRIMDEFFDQGDKEKALGLPVSPMMDRETASKASGQIGFIRFIVAPLFDVFTEFIPELKPCCQVMQSNLEYWEITREQQKTVRSNRRLSRVKLDAPNLSNNPSSNNTAVVNSTPTNS
ncbi:hypothetical protein RFI_24817 [Reticulomyxa filosa]|uniref:Phosphodiesterase n=1 Tax=Reticulomyxa filosa TaxID=46433 RepID=X6MEV8_RETFI|nr:hypothetical protein RFI_24817 [Reticulomyxa filosa]|eukprot:ETO12558.1 hypothetical protein RFI_24817 [Reticulomyxa filosa]